MIYTSDGSLAASASYIWTAWNEPVTYTTSSSITPTFISAEWINQTQTYTYTKVDVTGRIWRIWEDAATHPYPAPAVITRTPEQQAALDRSQREERARAEQLQLARQKADAAAEKLLLEHLAPEQRVQLKRDAAFEVLSKSGRRRYRIKRGWVGNVVVIDDESGKQIEQLCIHPAVHVPDADNMLAQKLMLEADEELFRNTANITRLAS